MAMRISALQPSGESILLEVTPEMTGELKRQIKELEGLQVWRSLLERTTF